MIDSGPPGPKALEGDSFWQDKKTLVSGGAGFIGSHLLDALSKTGTSIRVVDSLETGSINNIVKAIPPVEVIQSNLHDIDSCIACCKNMDVVLNLAAKVAGVAYNSMNPAEMFRSNVKIGLNMLEAARISDVERFLVVSSACVYSRDATVPTPEVEGFRGDPEPSNLGYGWAKRVLELQARLYAQQYGMKIAIVRPFNTYGPRDHFDLEYGHVIPSLVRKVAEGRNPLVVWGDGSQTRSFVYVTDVVSTMIQSVKKYAVADPVNVGSDEEVTIANLANMIIDLSGMHTRVQFDRTKPSGQPRRCPDLTKLRSKLGVQNFMRLRNGLRNTVDWYMAQFRTATPQALTQSSH